MDNFDYAAPTSLDEAVGLLSSREDRVRFLAGGTDIIVQLREGGREADLVLDLKKIPELMKVSWTKDGGLVLGAAVPCHLIYGDERISTSYPALADATRIIGGWQIQGRASVGGNLCNSSPAADSIPAMIACQATCHIVGSGGRRSVPVEEFCTAPGKNVLEDGEFLASLEFPPPSRGGGSHYLRFIPRNEMDIAVVGSGAWLRLDSSGEKIEEARIALAAVAPRPLFADDAAASLVGKEPTEENFTQAGELARKIATPISDMRGPADYRVHLVGVLTRRALTRAAERAKASLNGKS